MTDLKCTQTDDALVWAQDFMKTIKDNNLEVSEDLMHGWFANAIECSTAIRSEEKISASEALYGFAAWLTMREETVTFSSDSNAAPAAELVKEWAELNNLSGPRDSIYPNNISQPPTKVAA